MRKPIKSKSVHRCFMTGRTCIHEQEIAKRQDNIEKKQGPDKAFVVMPFTPDLDAIYNWQIKPFLERGGDNEVKNYSCDVQRADDVWQVGFIICTKICKQIQMANLVVVDLTFDNPNVFYEFGISSALRKKILPIAMGRELDKNDRADYLKNYFGIQQNSTSDAECKVIKYPDFGFMKGNINETLYHSDILPESANGDQVLILYDSSSVVKVPNKHGLGTPATQDYDFGKICNTASSTAIRNIFYPRDSDTNGPLSETKKRYRDKVALKFSNSDSVCDETTFIKEMVVDLDLSKSDFETIAKAISNSGCVIIDIREHDPRAFFWLGYLHAIGAHVIPVSASKIKSNDAGDLQRTMAFDISGLWYAQFNPNEPLVFQITLSDIIGYIYDEKAKQLQKDAFWQKILSDRPVSVFLGTVSEEKLGRNSLGDWDYRSAAEITSFLSQKSHKVVLENPIIKPSNPDQTHGGKEYLEILRKQLDRKNCIIIGSADINELTEVVWATIHGHTPFKKISDDEMQTTTGEGIDCFIALKEYAGLTEQDKKKLFGYGSSGMSSFILQDTEIENKEKRGFIYRKGVDQQTKILRNFISHQSAKDNNEDIRKLYGQLIVCRNPWSLDNWIIIINGTSGPATLGITQILTGCQYEDFTIRADSVKENIKEEVLTEWFKNSTDKNDKGERLSYNELSENRLTECLNFMEGDSSGFEGIVEVGVYYPSKELLNDERKVVGWRFNNIEDNLTRVSIPNPRKRNWLDSTSSRK